MSKILRWGLVFSIILLGSGLLGESSRFPLSAWLEAGRPGIAWAQADDPSAPAQPVKLVFVHHSTGGYWLADNHGQLGIELKNNNYFVSATNYGWGANGIGDRTDIGHWYSWFGSGRTDIVLNALYTESNKNIGDFGDFTRLATDPGGQNEIIVFKSCFPNSALQGNLAAPIPAIASNPLRGQDANSAYHTVSNAKGIYLDLLTYFQARPDKLFVVITAPPLSDGTYATNARAFNLWLMDKSAGWLKDYPLNNVAVFDFYNVLTTNGGDADTNDYGLATGSHHRWWNSGIQYKTDGGSNVLAYPTGDDHPSAAGDQKAAKEFVPLLNIFYHRWKDAGGGSTATPTTTPTETIPVAPTATPTGTPPPATLASTSTATVTPTSTTAATATDTMPPATPTPTRTATTTQIPIGTATTTATGTPPPATPTATSTAAATRTSTITAAATSTATATKTAAPATSTATPTVAGFLTSTPVSIVSQVIAATDIVNEEGVTFLPSDSTFWLGSGANPQSSYTGLRFTNLAIPRGATITSAFIQIYMPTSAWNTMAYTMCAEATASSLPFSSSNKPSQRSLTTQKVLHLDNVQWLANTWYNLDQMAEVIQEVINRSDWQSGNSLAIILRGGSPAWGRKFPSGYTTSAPGYAPKLIIVYTPLGAMEISTETPIATSTVPPATPTATRTATATQVSIETATATRTPTATAAATSTATATKTAAPATSTATPTVAGFLTSTPVSIVSQVTASADIANEDGATFLPSDSTFWFGSGANSQSSYTGLRFTNLAIPRGATITSAFTQVYMPTSGWNTVAYTVWAEATASSLPFSSSNKPSQRSLTTQKVLHLDNVQWLANTWYNLDQMPAVIQEVINRSDWQNGNSLAIILKGGLPTWGRKFPNGYTTSAPGYAPKLIIVYTP